MKVFTIGDRGILSVLTGNLTTLRAAAATQLLPEDSAERKTYPVSSGVLDYFPSALVAVANHSFKGNEKHNPGEPLHWSRGKSADHLDAAVRHIMERDLVGAAWRVLAALQMQLESEGAPVAVGAKVGAD